MPKEKIYAVNLKPIYTPGRDNGAQDTIFIYQARNDDEALAIVNEFLKKNPDRFGGINEIAELFMKKRKVGITNASLDEITDKESSRIEYALSRFTPISEYMFRR